MLKKLWNDEGGAVVSPELCVVGAILVVGLIVGISSVQTAISTEIEDVGEAIESFDFTPTLEPINGNLVAPQNSSDAPLTAADLINP
jgi:Flp pilus assembly pilin Flp